MLARNHRLSLQTEPIQRQFSSDKRPKKFHLPPIIDKRFSADRLTVPIQWKIRSPLIERNSSSETLSKRCLLTDAEQQLVLQHPLSLDISKLASSVIDNGFKIRQLISKNRQKDDEGRLRQHLKHSHCLILHLYNILSRMIQKGRLGADMKGINRQIVEQIEEQVLPTVSTQIKIYICNYEYRQRKQNLLKEVDRHKKDLCNSIQITKML